MKFKAKSAKWNKVEADVVTIFVSQENWEKELVTYNKATGGQLITYLKADQFEAKEGTLYHFPTMGKIVSSALWIVGLGKTKEFTAENLRTISAKIARQAKREKKKVIAFDLAHDAFDQIQSQTVAQAMTEGVSLGAYKFTKYKSEAKKNPFEIEQILLLTVPSKIQYVTNGIAEGELFAEATLFARDLVNESPSITTPTYLAQVAKNLAKKEDVTVEILDEKEIKKLGMEAYLAVSRGSNQPPKFIKLTYKGGRKKVVIAGKAITFDTGGLSLKDSKNMETMKLDMAGAAAVLGIFSVLPKLKPKATVVGLIAACENMPGPNATKPGDIVTALNGKTIEILNTDAEGRLTLADVLSYAAREKPEWIIDLATLTGACMVALGEEIAGLFSNNKELTHKISQAAETAGEKVWELPLEKEYLPLVQADLADLRNIGKNRYGGAITAALFLEEFVDKIPWVHLDIAGPAFAERDTPLIPLGGTGFGVRTLLNLLKTI